MKRLCHGCREAFDAAALAPLEDGSVLCAPCRARLGRSSSGVALPIIEDAPRRPFVDRAGWIDVSIGGALAIGFLIVPIFGCVTRTLLTLFHEFGHTVFHWSFGYPAVPAFDMMEGGGVTLAVDRSTGLAVLCYLSAAGLAGWLWRTDRRTLAIGVGAACAVHALFGLTGWHLTAIAYMGHGTELALGGVFLYRALANRSIVHRVERPLYAGLGLYAVFANVEFAIRLLADPRFVAHYLRGKHGIANDFIQVASHLGTTLGTVAVLHLLACALPVAGSLLAARAARRSA